MQTGGGACEHPTAPFARPGVCTSASYRGVTGSEGQEGENGVEVGLESAAGTETVTESGVGAEVNEGAQDGDGDGSGDGAGTGTGVETHRRTSEGNGDEDNGNENRIGKGGREAKKRKKPQNSCRRHAGNGGDLGGKRKICRKKKGWSSSCHSR